MFINELILWSEILIRWLHVIAGIAWIGSSFYFIALDYSLQSYNTKLLKKELSDFQKYEFSNVNALLLFYLKYKNKNKNY